MELMNMTRPGLEFAATSHEEVQPGREDIDGQFAPEEVGISLDAKGNVETYDILDDSQHSHAAYFEELVASFYTDECIVQFRQMLDTYSDGLHLFAAQSPITEFHKDCLGHDAEEENDNNNMETTSDQQL
eukprot:4092866-Pyramimonas_sp.AAC.1